VVAENIKRRLTAILAADAVGYSRMMGSDEENTLRILSAHRAVIDGIIEFHDGRIVGTAGDSVLAEFASSVDAVRCAVEIQEALKTRNDALPEGRRLLFRIGVNLGDVMVKGDDLLGDGVNVAARLEGIAEPGGVCISSSVYDQIAGKLNLGFVDAGEQSLKNISKPVHVYRVAGSRSVALAAVPPRRRFGTAAVLTAMVAIVGVIVAAWKVDWLLQAARDQTGAASPPKAGATLVQERAQAELERLRAAAEAMRAQAQAELGAAARARQQAEAKAAEAKPAATASSPGARASPGVAASRFDGQWTVDRSCEAFRNRPAVDDRFLATVRDGAFLVERGEHGQPAYQRLQGKPAGDGSLILTGTASPGARFFKGQEFPVYLEGRLEGKQFLLKGTYGRRPCSLVIARVGG